MFLIKTLIKVEQKRLDMDFRVLPKFPSYLLGILCVIVSPSWEFGPAITSCRDSGLTTFRLMTGFCDLQCPLKFFFFNLYFMYVDVLLSCSSVNVWNSQKSETGI